ncbi:MAG: regulatory protein RecX [Leptospiraceae bacterium]|nr:regulatory protein RecX [Leptospiraceae bacterium]MCP5496176.1 regulatory protein RecX [Leptospiraceae bacterium]
MAGNINPLSNAYNKIIKLIKIRDRSSQEIEYFLLREGVDKTLISKFILSLKEDGLIDDEKFAKNRILSRIRLKGWGKFRINGELLSLGISKEIIQQELEKIPEEDWLSEATKIIQKQLKKSSGSLEKDSINIRKKLFLKGYGEDMIQKVIKKLELSPNNQNSVVET